MDVVFGGCGFLFIIIALVLLVAFFTGLRVANEYERAVVFRLGRAQRHSRAWALYWLIPFGIEQQQEGRTCERRPSTWRARSPSPRTRSR